MKCDGVIIPEIAPGVNVVRNEKTPETEVPGVSLG